MTSQDAELEGLVRGAICNASRPGTAGAVEALLSRIYPTLLGYAMKMTLQRDVAEDVCQEAMVKVITGLRRYRPVEGRVAGSFMAWVMSIATNAYRDMLRKSSRTVTLSDTDEETKTTTGLDAAAESPSLEDLAMVDLQMETVEIALNALPYEQRTAFVLRTYYDFSYREIGEVCGCPEGTAKSRVHVAVLALRDQLKNRRMLV